VAPTNHFLRIGLTLFLCAGTAPVASGALSVGINFEGKASFSASAMAGGESAGVQPQAFWNNAAGGSGSLTALLDCTGAASGVSVNWSGYGSYHAGIPNNPGSQHLMRGLITNLGADPATVTVAGLGTTFPSGFDVLVYFDGFNQGTAWATDFSIGTLVLRGTDLTNTDFTGTFVRDTGAGGNYVRFEHIKSDTFVLSAAPLAGSTATINAIQLIHAPEPATLGLLGLGAVASFLVRQLRRASGVRSRGV
jgi:hypothetical protein